MSVSRICTLTAVKRMNMIRNQISGTAFQRISSRSFSMSNSLLERYYTPKHEWVNVEGNVGTVGVSKYAADALGDVVYAQLPEPGDDIEIGGEVGALESVKAASEVYSPVSGKVMEKNDQVEDGPALINQSPEGDGWLYKLELSNPDEVLKLMKSDDYEKYLGTLADE